MKRLFLLVCCWSIASTALAIDNLTLTLGTIAGTGWQAKGVVVQLQPHHDNTLALTLDIATLDLPTLKTPLQKLSLTCPNSQYSAEQISCPQATLQIGNRLLDKPAILAFNYQIKQQHITLNISKFPLADGNVTLQANSTPTGWQAELAINQVDLEKLLFKINSLIPLSSTKSENSSSGFKLGGKTNLHVKLTGNSDLQHVAIEGQATNFSFSNPSGTQSGEKLAAKLVLTAQANHEKSINWQVQSSLTVNNGEIYSEPIYVNIQDKPVTASIKAAWQPDQLKIQEFIYRHQDVLNWQAQSTLRMAKGAWNVDNLAIKVQPTELNQFYLNYLKAWLINHSLFNALEATGRLDAKFLWNQQKSELIANIHNANIADSQKRFGWEGVNGVIQWNSQAADKSTILRWSRAYFASQLELGASQVQLNMNSQETRLLTPWQQTILDGALQIERFNLTNLGKESMQWELTGEIRPISMQKLSTALGLPPLQGQFSSKIPLVRYHNGVIEIGGAVSLQLFDGNIIIHTLRLKNPFGNLPELTATIDVDNLNLATLTQTYKFGEIQGHLSGKVQELHLLNWQPVAFDAYFVTPEHDTLPHKISQKAISNLSNIGGGGAADMLSRGVLRVFENFSYQRIGWGCRLSNGICEMRGVEPAKQGYYIVKGGGLPRIDVIGYNNRVNWDELLTRLKNITNLQAPVIQ